MTTQSKRRWRPRFGLKSLFALVLVVAAYCGSWPWLEERAKRDVDQASERLHNALAKKAWGEPIKWAGARTGRFDPVIYFNWQNYAPTSPAPYIVISHEASFDKDQGIESHRRYYLWLFGWTVRLPGQSSTYG